MFRSALNSATLRVCLAAAIGLSPSAAVVAQQAAQNNQTQPARLDLRYATEQSFAGLIARPRQVLTAPEMRMLPYEVIQAAGQEHLGIDPLTVEELQVFVEPPQLGPPQVLIVVRFSEPFELDQLNEQVTQQTERAELEGRPYLQSTSPMGASLFTPDDRTLLVGTDEMLRRAYAAGEDVASGSLIDRLQRLQDGRDLVAAVEFAPIRPLLNAQIQRLPPLPTTLESFKNAPNLIEAVEASLGVTGGDRASGFSLVVYATDEQAARELETLALEGLKLWQQQMLAAFAESQQSEDAVAQAMGRYMQRISGDLSAIYRPVRDGERLVFFGGEREEGSEQMVQVATIGVLVALLLPAVQAAREAARRTQSLNNLRHLALALLNYEDANGHFPPHASYGRDGKPLLSWRVHVLPYFEIPEARQLYEQFHLDEPWDSEHNLKLVEQMPDVYADPSSAVALAEYRSSYVAPYGEGLFMEGTEGIRMGQFMDGTSKTIAVLEVDDDHAPIWTRPHDMAVDLEKPAVGLGGKHPGIFLAVFVDGHVDSIAQAIDPQVLKALLTRGAGDRANP